jgi:hypothetical protein
MLDAEGGGARKRSLGAFLVSWFPFLGPKAGGDALKSPSKKKFSFMRRSFLQKDTNTANREREQDSVTIDNSPGAVINFKGEENGPLAFADGSHPHSMASTRTSLKGESALPFPDGNGRPASSRTSVKKRPSSRRFKGISRGRSQKFEITEDMMNLQRIILDQQHRQRLIELLVPLDGDSSVRVRFCCAVEEFQREKDKKLRNKKGAHIVRMFIRKGSMFRLKGVAKE